MIARDIISLHKHGSLFTTRRRTNRTKAIESLAKLIAESERLERMEYIAEKIVAELKSVSSNDERAATIQLLEYALYGEKPE